MTDDAGCPFGAWTKADVDDWKATNYRAWRQLRAPSLAAMARGDRIVELRLQARTRRRARATLAPPVASQDTAAAGFSRLTVNSTITT